LGFEPVTSEIDANIVIIHTAHEEFNKIDFKNLKNLRFILDGRGFLDKGLRIIEFHEINNKRKN
jgi:UDP-N-acetyl-D-mannosaminuronate dehydrogenase